MSLPSTREELRQRWEAGERFEFYFFYGHKQPAAGVDASCLSQWFARAFEVDGIDYPTAEHWMMAEKARLFQDETMLAEILSSEDPRDAKASGRKVDGFDQDRWSEHRFQIVKRGNLAKFGQHDDLKAFLLSTAEMEADVEYGKVAESTTTYETNAEGSQPDHVNEQLGLYSVPRDEGEESASDAVVSNVILVEAAGRDTIWGIGLGKSNPKSLDPGKWRGLNLLGFALTEVREELSRQASQS